MTLASNFPHDVTHWPVTGSDGYGGFTFGTPVVYKCRWEEKQELFIDPNREEVLSNAIVYLLNDMDVGDFVAYGDYVTGTPVTDPTTLTTSFRIRQRNRSTDLRNLVALRKVFL